MLPSRYTSKESLDDAAEIAKLLGVSYDTIPIEPAVAAFGSTLAPVFAGKRIDTTEENIQSRIRGVILMAISNKFGPMVLTTGNKSEMSVGYATLYGDMCGGYNVLKDVYKLEVFALSRWRNQCVPRAQPRSRRPRHSGECHHPSADRPNYARTRRTRIRCRPTRCSTASSNAWSRTR